MEEDSQSGPLASTYTLTYLHATCTYIHTNTYMYHTLTHSHLTVKYRCFSPSWLMELFWVDKFLKHFGGHAEESQGHPSQSEVSRAETGPPHIVFSCA